MASQDETPLFSVVMPVYNMGAYLEQAIDNIQRQSFQDWELLLVDDCSTDRSLAIALEAASRDPRIRLVQHETNEGLAQTRNSGIDEAKGVYLWFPDPDDSYDLDLLEQAASLAAAEDPDVIMFGLIEEYYDRNENFLYNHEIPTEQASYADPQDWHSLIVDIERRTLYGYAWNKFYRRSIIDAHGLRFVTELLIEDFVFNVAFFNEARSLAFLDGCPYHYVKRERQSLTNSNAYSAADYYDVHRKRIKLLREQLEGWGVLEAGRPVVGSLYMRYLLSTLERSYYPNDLWTKADRRSWLQSVFDDELYQELAPSAQAQSSRMLSLATQALKGRREMLCFAMGRGLAFSRRHLYRFYTQRRSER